MNGIEQFLQDPTVKVELEITDQAIMRLTTAALVISLVVFSLMFIYQKIKN